MGGAPVANAVDMAQKLAGSDVFTNCMSSTLLQEAMAEYDTSAVEMPTPPDPTNNPFAAHAAGCAALDVSARYKSNSGQNFSDMVKAVALSPSFAIRAAQ
jgi:hypothetical protein